MVWPDISCYPNRRIKKEKVRLTGKMCKKCKTFKLITEYNKNYSNRDGHNCYCKICHRKAVRACPLYAGRYKLMSPEQKANRIKRVIERRKERLAEMKI